ncbi:hypothetical protein MPY17_25305 [Rhodococcus opacus]|uniref:hypothetical protein n=1 Tax=Rhodococcus opacus TaxID=37919 RepID=UPI001FF2A15D|nr:hypothetical protein [Rhodococcus opacus]UOT02269.1 hypothetical protein MPY17_25305 [Rhodococcus opacus]
MSQSVTGIKVTGINGAVFDLVNGTEGAVLTDGLGGVLLPSFERQDTKTARGRGRRVGGLRWNPTTMRARVTVADTRLSVPRGAGYRTGAPWLALDRTFKGAFSPLQPTLVEVSTPNGPRTYRGRLESLQDVTEGGGLRDIAGRADYELTLGADLPFWQGAPVVYDFLYSADAGDNYYGPSNAAPPFYIARGNALATAVVLNPGQVPAYPTWTVTGPVTATVGIGDHLTEVTALAAGQSVTLVTEPTTQAITDEAGGRAWGAVRSWDFAAIPPGESSTVVARMVGGGPGASIRLTLTPNYLSYI